MRKQISHAQRLQNGIHEYNAGNVAGAKNIFAQLIAEDPSNCHAFFYLGRVLFNQGLCEEAKTKFEQILKIRPDFEQAHYWLGLIFEELNRPQDAVQCYNQAISLNSKFTPAYINLGFIFFNRQSWEKAAQCYEASLQITPNDWNTCNTLGLINLKLKSVKKAIEYYERSLALNANQPIAYYNLGLIFFQKGDFERAGKNFEEAFRMQENLAEAYRAYSLVKKFSGNEEIIHKIEKLLSGNDFDQEGQMHLYFALGKIYGDMNNYDRSFAMLKKGNDIKRAFYAYSTSESKTIFDSIKDIFKDKTVSTKHQKYDVTTIPVFILGMPRSGTSLAEQILASHPQVYGCGELHNLDRVLAAASGKNYLPDSLRSLYGYPDSENIVKVGNMYLNSLDPEAQKSIYFTDKMPSNFLFIGAICMSMPHAKIIHCKRNPADTCLSIYKNYFPESAQMPFAYNLKELAEYYLLYLDLMSFWQAKFPEHIYEIQYENLISDTEREIEILLKFCGLPWDERCLSFHKSKRIVTTSSATQVRQPIYNDSVKLWKSFAKELHPLLEIFDSASLSY